MRLSDIMTTPVRTVAPDLAAREAWTLMRTERIHHLVVTQGRKIVGVLSTKDFAGQRSREGASVADLMAATPITAGPDLHVREAANLMRGRSIGCLPICERKDLVGIVTVSDLLSLIGRGAVRPVVRGERWTLKHRGPRRRAGARVGR